MKRGSIYFFLLCLFISSRAFHIVGGEIEFIYLRDGLYRINLIQYFDNAQNQNPGPDPSATVFIFRNSDNALMSQHLLEFVSQEVVQYTNIECARDELQTSRIFYTAEVTLDPNFYSDAAGYYIQWERCCRNSTVKNIINPDGTGMNYVLEIPPLMKNGKVFVNSSPVLFKPLSDYACINQLYYTEFTGIDPDGDSLVYSLVTPLNSSSQVAIPLPQPKPHFDVTFSSGYSESNIIPGSSPLRISSDGLLTVKPSETGLFVFSVTVDEYRDGIRIGQVRRDFQMLVVDGCEPPDPPVVDINIPDQPTFDPSTDILTYTVADAKCFNFLVSNITPGERISLRAKGVNFNEDLNEIFSFRDSLINEGSDLTVEICIPDCPPLRDEPFILDLIAADDACPLPQLDTVRLTIRVQPPPNEKPIAVFDRSPIIQEEDNDPIFNRVIEATDPDSDNIEFRLLVNGIEDPTSFGFDLRIDSVSEGFTRGAFVWDTDCTVYDYSENDAFSLQLIVEDADECLVPGDTIMVDASVLLPLNTDPRVTVDQILPAEINLGETLRFNAMVNDTDGDEVFLRFVGGNFNPEFYGVNFPDADGISTASSEFTWDLSCDADRYSDGQQFLLLFVGDDADKCKTKNFDTLRHLLTVNYPENTSPTFSQIARTQRLRVNEPVSIPVTAFDSDNDAITLELDPSFRAPSSPTFQFAAASGTGTVNSFIEWQPECALLRFGQSSGFQDVILLVTDNACPIPNSDTLKLTFEIFDDAERRDNFLPPNVFTPNGDQRNDTFKLFGNFDINQNLPPDNCDNFFEYIIINNRAGVPIFKSESRDFVWTGGDFPAGMYYYYIKFSRAEFKGYVHLIR